MRTGDEGLFRKGPNGHEHLFIVDRIKELIKVKGHQVAPAELEARLLGHPHVGDVAVIQVPDEAAGILPKAFVVRSPASAALSEDQLQKILYDHSAHESARYKWLDGGIEFVDEIPKSPSRKILRRLLRDVEAKKRSGKLVAKL